jgi:hypothetical protein
VVLLLNRPEEDWLDKISIIDSLGVWHDHLRTLVFSFLLFGFYGFFLLIICSSTTTLLTLILLFGSQVLLGLPASRGYSDLGILTRQKMRLYDAVVTNHSTSPEEVVLKPETIPVAFERLSFHAQRADKTATDDFNDISWFIVLAWSVLSTAIFSFGLIGHLLLALLGDLVLAVACSLSYLGGYRTHRGISFEDQVAQLEYFVTSRIRAIDEKSQRFSHSTIFLLRSRIRRLYVADILVKIETLSDIEFEYRMGLPSGESERLILDAPDTLSGRVKGCLEALPMFTSGSWRVEEIQTQSSKILRAINVKSVDISEPATYLKSPETQADEIEFLSDVLRTILDEIEKS